MTMLGSSTGGATMKGYVQNIEGIAVKNEDFRRVLYTAKTLQLVVMALKPREEIGMEAHNSDQFFRVEEGTGEAIIMAFARWSARASPCSSLVGRTTTSSIPAMFH